MSRLPEDEQILSAATAAAGDMAYAWDIAADTITWAGDTSALFGADTAEISSGEGVRERIAPSDRGLRWRALSSHVDIGTPFDCDYRVRLADGEFHWVHDRGSVERAEDGAPRRLLGVLRVIDHRKERESRLARQAHFDPLTGLANRHRLREVLEEAVDSARRHGRGGAFLAIGIDRLSAVNEAWGPAAGDSVVVEVAQRLALCLRATDVIGRLGGDLFGVVLAHCPPDDLVHAAARLLAAAHGQPVATPSGPVHVTVSVGGAVLTAGITVDEVMRRAEAALRDAKRQGGDTHGFHEEGGDRADARQRGMTMGGLLREGLDAGRLRLAFQPVVDEGGGVEFYECLGRMVAPDGRLMEAGEFMTCAERQGMARRLDLRALDLVMDELERYPAVRLSVNVSGLSIGDPAWLALLISRVGARPELACRLVVEITETADIPDLAAAARFAATVRGLGCRVALDDFGAGYLTYRHLKALPVDLVKIDGAFVGELAEGPRALVFIRSLVGLARGLGLVTVAEGVESEEQARILRREGVALFQGWHCGRPAVIRPWLTAEDGGDAERT